MQGYVFSDAQQTGSALTQDGFLKTGDIGYVDKEGYLFIVDRAKEMIKVKGQVNGASAGLIFTRSPS